jgi:hypothetical protein
MKMNHSTKIKGAVGITTGVISKGIDVGDEIDPPRR